MTIRAAELGHPAAMTMSVTGHKNEAQMYADYSQSYNDRVRLGIGLGNRLVRSFAQLQRLS